LDQSSTPAARAAPPVIQALVVVVAQLAQMETGRRAYHLPAVLAAMAVLAITDWVARAVSEALLLLVAPEQHQPQAVAAGPVAYITAQLVRLVALVVPLVVVVAAQVAIAPQPAAMAA
jgi:hypothetical protein